MTVRCIEKARDTRGTGESGMAESNGTYATGGFVGKGKKHKGEHRKPETGLIARLLGASTGKKDK